MSSLNTLNAEAALSTSGYTATSSMSSSTTSTTQKNYTYSSGSDDDYTAELLKTAEWTSMSSGTGKVTVTASYENTSTAAGTEALFVFTTCLEHGLTVDVVEQDIKDLCEQYDTVVCYYTLYAVWVVDTADLTVTKQIDADDIVWENGSPSFLITVTGSDVEGAEYTYSHLYTFDEDDFADSSGNVTVAYTFEDVWCGTYTVTEKTGIRYELESITDVSDNGSTDTDSVTFDLINYDAGSATFVNGKTNGSSLTNTAYAVNAFD